MALRIDGSKTHHPRSGESPTELRQINQEFKDVVSHPWPVSLCIPSPASLAPCVIDLAMLMQST
jgi:hypothetical protein